MNCWGFFWEEKDPVYCDRQQISPKIDICLSPCAGKSLLQASYSIIKAVSEANLLLLSYFLQIWRQSSDVNFIFKLHQIIFQVIVQEDCVCYFIL
jgi:hypothetical protein